MILPKTVPLVQKPTTLHPLPRLSRALGGPELWIKRDDNTGLALGGNKARKLEYLLYDAVHGGYTDVITVGGIQSNHARMTAAAAASLGLRCHLVLRGSQRERQGNLFLDHLFGARVHLLHPGEDREACMESLAAQLRQQGRRPYCIGVGGSNSLGSLGYVAAVQELHGQMEAPDMFSHTVVAVGSGGTYAGLWVGQTALHWSTHLQGIAVDQEEFEPIIREIAEDSAERFGTPLPNDETLHVDYGHIGEGYAKPSQAGMEAIHLFAQHEGILLDPVYTGKAAAGLIFMIRSGLLQQGQRVLFWHTGGAPALFAAVDTFEQTS